MPSLLKSLKNTDEPLAIRLKEHLSSSEEELRKAHLSSGGGIDVCTSYSGIIDDILKTLYKLSSDEVGGGGSTAMVAIGGYGRGELNLRSDIDLMLLYDKKLDPRIKKLTEKMLYILWDTGLDMGFSLRSVDECITLAKSDLNTKTSLLDRRFIMGDPALIKLLDSGIVKRLFPKRGLTAFIDAKLEESRERHKRYGGSVYILEPNVKEGEGGLRDLHTARWVVKARNPGGGSEAEELLSAQERKELNASLDFLLWVRNELHFETNRKTDQLTFDHQERISALLGYSENDRGLAVESFMQSYYKHASKIKHHSALMLSRSLANGKRTRGWFKKSKRLDEHFDILDGVISLREAGAPPLDPSSSVKVFEYVQAFDAEIDSAARDALMSFFEGAGTELGESKEVGRSFLKILAGEKVFNVLTEMRKLKFLDTYMPEFADVSCKVQHDLYHVYTVDVHTLFAIREIDRLKASYKYDFNLIATVCEELKARELLMLGILFHDIGKAHGTGHSEKGAEIAERICTRLGMAAADIETVVFLVRQHLILANTAQYRDLHDRKLIVEFARKVGDIERLNMLYLLTFADVRAVGPDVWSQWKGALFQELYLKAFTVIERGSYDIEAAAETVKRIKLRVVELMEPEGIGERAVDDFFALLPDRYFLSNGPELIAGHLKTLSELGTKPYIMNVRQDSDREYTELVICTNDVHHLFSMITGVMTANGVDIMGAQINTLKNGIALDILQVVNSFDEAIIDKDKAARIEADLAMVISGKRKVEGLVKRRQRPSILDKKAAPTVRTRVEVDNTVSEKYTVIDIHARNRVGLLYDISNTFTALGLFIHIAKISTKGEGASDIFYLRDIFGQKVTDTEKLTCIKATLYECIEEQNTAVK
jgi:[protein-PII] uridylyltransferase